MKSKILYFVALMAISFMVVLSCKKEDEIGPNDKNSLILHFENKVGDEELTLNTGSYKNTSGEDFTISTFNYFVSNVTIKKTDGTLLKYPDNYFLVRAADANSQQCELVDLPAGDYTEVSFVIGVDSTRSVSDVSQRTGVLDPASYGTDNMYWSWNSGYIFTKIEGISSSAPSNSAGIKKFEYHVGGFGGKTTVTPNNLRNITLTLPQNAMVRKNIAPEIHVFADVSKVFSGNSNLKIAETSSVHSIGLATPIANNIAKMFTIDHVHNSQE